MGSGKLVKLRRLSQIIFFAIFMLLLLRTEFRGSIRGAGTDIRLPYPVRLFFELDPLVGLSNALASHALYRGLLWSLSILIGTLFLGRFFCGWICPMGSIHHFFGSLKSESKRGKQLIESNRYKRWQNTKYYVLFAVLVASLLGSGLVGWIDPFSLLVRSMGLSILPGINYALNAAFQSMEANSFAPIHMTGGALHAVFNIVLLNFKQPYFRQGIFLGIIFVFILALNLRVTRFWCRAICPLGALLGIVSRWAIFGLQKNADTCNNCNRCLMRCQGGDDPTAKAPWHKSECVMCLNCVDSCPEHSLNFKFFPDGTTPVQAPDLQRRKAFTGIAAGAAVIPLMRSTSGLTAGRDERLMRPPGSLKESDFLQRCIRCGECMKVCPNNALHPAFTEAGLEGIWTPVVVPHIGYCEPSCVLCSQVCPTGAIWEITAKEKGWVVGVGNSDAKPIRLGTAFYDRGRCLPWAMATDCIVCEEWCPTSPKAIYVQEAEVIDANGKPKTIKQPRVNPERCVGCGSCEHACVLQDRAAIAVTSVGESRSRDNQILLNKRETENMSTRTRLRAAAFIAIAVSMLIVGGCKKQGSAAQPLPASNEVAGWEKTGETRAYTSATLSDYIDGGSEQYLKAGFKSVSTSDYKFQGKIEAVADVYVMSNANAAKTIFEADPAGNAKIISLGDAARVFGQSVIFRDGPYLVRVVAYQDSPDAPQALTQLAQGIDKKLSK